MKKEKEKEMEMVVPLVHFDGAPVQLKWNEA